MPGPTSFTVANTADLNAALKAIDVGGTSSAINTAYTISFSSSFTLTGQLFAINLASGDTLAINGNGDTLNGGGTYNGFFVDTGQVSIGNLAINNAKARGGAGGGATGGAGAGLGGGLFVASAGRVTLSNVTFQGDSATGGAGGGTDAQGGGSGGGGGLDGGAGGTSPGSNGGRGYGGGGIGLTAKGGEFYGTGAAGIVLGAAGGGAGGGSTGQRGGATGGGGGGLGKDGRDTIIYSGGGGGGVGGSAGSGSSKIGYGGNGGNGGFGGGGGGGGFSYIDNGLGGTGGFGGGGGGNGGNGGFGGGGGGNAFQTGFGGFGGGNGGYAGGGGGGGLGAGGAIFVQQGGSLSFASGGDSGGSVTAGAGGYASGGDGAAFGSGLFIQGNQQVTFDPGTGQKLTIGDVIADQTGSGGTSGNAGIGSLLINGTGTVDLASTNTFTGGIMLRSGTLQLAAPGAAGSGTITVGPLDPNLQFSIANAPTTNTIAKFAQGDTIDVTNLTTTATLGTYNSATSTLSVPYTNNGGGTLNLKLTGNFTGEHFHLTPDGSGGTDITVDNTVCYLAGTRILTDRGEIAVEMLRPGDKVITVASDMVQTSQRALPVKWIGRRRINLSTHPRPKLAAPVRIQRGAFADNIPHRDLLVSPDHAIFVGGKLICARQLVNGATIRQEQGLSKIEYFHVELDTHAILLAEGLPAESYLDTGNRGFFGNSQEPRLLHPELTGTADNPTREAASCAPFVWDEANVRPIWQRLAERAAALGQPVPVPDTTTDPHLCIVADGRTLRPLSVANGRHCFMVPSGATAVRLTSRAAAPTDMRPWLEDRRRLGVYVERIVLRGNDKVQDIPLDHPALSQGWWAMEHAGMTPRRWTDSDALLPLPLPVVDGPLVLEVHASNGGLAYPVGTNDLRHAA